MLFGASLMGSSLNMKVIVSLVEECGKKLARGITKENALELGMIAETYEVEDLTKRCAKFVAANMVEVLRGDWKDQLKDSPGFLIRILSCVKEEKKSRGSNGGRYR